MVNQTTTDVTPVGAVNLMECGRNDARDRAGDTDSYAVAATPVTAAQVWKAWVRAARYWLAGRRSRRRWNRLLIPSWAERKRWAWPGDLNRFICRSRWRVG